MFKDTSVIYHRIKREKNVMIYYQTIISTCVKAAAHERHMNLVHLISQTTNCSNARHCSAHGEIDLSVVQATLL